MYLVRVPPNLFCKMNVCVKILILSCIYGLSITVRHHLNSEETVRAVQMVEDGFSHLWCPPPPSVVDRLWARYLKTGNYSIRPAQGRSRATSDHQNRHLRNI